MDAETFYQLGIQAVEMATEYLEGIPEKPVYRPMTPSERQLLLYQQLSEHGRSPEALFDFFEQHILPHAMGNQHPRFAAWVNPAGAPIGMLAEFSGGGDESKRRRGRSCRDLRGALRCALADGTDRLSR